MTKLSEKVELIGDKMYRYWDMINHLCDVKDSKLLRQ